MERPKGEQPLPSHARKVFEGVIFDIYQWEQEMYDGSIEVFEKAARKKDAVAVFTVMENGNVLLLDQEQPGRESFISAPGGMIEPGETPEEAAHRELREETGCVASDMTLWYALQPQRKTDWVVYMYIATGCRKEHEPTLESGEKIAPREVPFDVFLEEAVRPEFIHEDVKVKVWEARNDTQRMHDMRTAFGTLGE